jgi:peptidoglycan/xylan/chitin deacetylase (PgdA/CDA1 family)
VSEPSRRVALTIDAEHSDHPTRPEAARELVELLARERVRATFFVQGAWAQANPGLAGRIAADGHLVGSHSHWHAPISLLTDEGIERDLERAAEALDEAAGVDPRPWFRCPYGDGGEDPRVTAILDRMGYRHRGWDIDPRDWHPESTPEGVAQGVLGGVDTRGDGAVVLLHVWPSATVGALPAVIAGLRDRGAELVGLDEVVEP